MRRSDLKIRSLPGGDRLVNSLIDASRTGCIQSSRFALIRLAARSISESRVVSQRRISLTISLRTTGRMTAGDGQEWSHVECRLPASFIMIGVERSSCQGSPSIHDQLLIWASTPTPSPVQATTVSTTEQSSG